MASTRRATKRLKTRNSLLWVGKDGKAKAKSLRREIIESLSEWRPIDSGNEDESIYLDLPNRPHVSIFGKTENYYGQQVVNLYLAWPIKYYFTPSSNLETFLKVKEACESFMKSREPEFGIYSIKKEGNDTLKWKMLGRAKDVPSLYDMALLVCMRVIPSQEAIYLLPPELVNRHIGCFWRT